MEGLQIINRYRLYLQLVSIYDLIQYDGMDIHPEITRGQRVQSQISTYFWVNFKRPPRKHPRLWQHFLKMHAIPYIKSTSLKWDTASQATYKTNYWFYPTDSNLYSMQYETYLCHTSPNYHRNERMTPYLIIGEPVAISSEITTTLQPVEVTHNKKPIQILCKSNINSHGNTQQTTPAESIQTLCDLLPTAIKRLCGKVHLPLDGGSKLIHHIKETNANLKGASDATLITPNCSHAWIISTGEIEHKDDPNMHISGSGMVDGADLSSTRGEIQGRTTVAIMANTFLKANISIELPITLLCDNQGVQRKCNSYFDKNCDITEVQTQISSWNTITSPSTSTKQQNGYVVTKMTTLYGTQLMKSRN
jgi:hypothetical protein